MSTLAVLTLLAAEPSLSAAFELTADQNSLGNGPDLEVRIEPDPAASIQGVLARGFPDRAGRRESLRTTGPSTLWTRQRLTNTSTYSDWVIFHPFVRMHERIDVFFVFADGGIQTAATGTATASSERNVNAAIQAVRFRLAPGQSVDMIMRFSTTSVIVNDFMIDEEGAFNSFSEFDVRLRWLFVGALAAYGALSLVIGVRQRSAVFLTFSGLALVNLANHIITQGDWALFTDFGAPWQAAWMGRVTTPLLAVFAFLFFRAFLGGLHSNPLMLTLVLAGAFGELLVATLPFFAPLAFADKVQGPSLFLTGMTLAGVAIAAALRGLPGARFLAVGWVPYIVDIMYLQLMRLGVAPGPGPAVMRHVLHSAFVLRLFTDFAVILGLAAYLRRMEKRRIQAELVADDRERLLMIIRVVSHDIANPLMAIISQAATILRRNTNPINPQLEASAERIKRAGGHIKDIMSQVKTMMSVGDHRVAVQRRSVSVARLVEGVRTTFDDRFAAKGLSFVVSNFAVGLALVGDEVLLSHNVFANLISNAIKFSPQSSTIFLDVHAGDNEVTLSIRDEGVGIPSVMLPQLFSLNEPTSRPGTAGEEGTGYGLAIVKAYLDAMGGRVAVASHVAADGPGIAGTTFTVTLPRAANQVTSLVT